MAKPLLPDELWPIIEPVLPKWVPNPKGGHLRLDDRKAPTGILFVLKTGVLCSFVKFGRPNDL